MIRFFKYFTVFLFGGTVYAFIEILWRGRTHWSMMLLGGICFLFIFVMKEYVGSAPIILRCIAAGAFITAAEYLTGFIVNIKLGWNVWDYSFLRLNVDGQISLLFSVLWIFLSFAAFMLCGLIQKIFKFIDNKTRE